MAGADAHFQHHRRVGRFGKLEAFFDHLYDGRQVRPRIEQPHLRLHGEGMRALLHDRGAFAVVLADDDQRAALHPAGSQIGDGVGSDVDADRRLERHRAADRIHHGRGERRRGGGFGRRIFEMHAEFVEHILGVGEHIHQMGNRRALITADIGNAGLQQRLGDRENALAAEFIAFAKFKILHFACKRPFCHESLQALAALHQSGARRPLAYLLTLPDCLATASPAAKPARVSARRDCRALRQMVRKIAQKKPIASACPPVTLGLKYLGPGADQLCTKA